MADNDELLRRIQALEAENAKLRHAVGGKDAPKQTTATIGMWKGFPIITFEGNFRPFSIGLKKAAVILDKLDDVRFFVSNNQNRIATAPDEDT